ncbi:MAG: ABC transporter permease subunit [Clostridiales Family XIII bacterium]|jgi:taurine transport system permease protein|nr:ABC transporter permease subunit [Clostridiales Family XIII bacterium]
MKKNKYKIISAISVCTVLLLWTIGSIFKWFNPVFIPPVKDVIDAFLEVWENGYKGYSLPFHIFSSMKRLFFAILLAFVTAVPIGLLAGISKVFLAIIDPFIEFYRALPPLAYYILLILWLGIEDLSKIILLFLSAFAPLFIATVFAVKKIPEARLNGAKSLGAGPIPLFFLVIFPSCLPDILTGLRTSVGVCYATLVAAEMVAAVSGIGWLVLDSSKYLRFDIVYFGIIIIGILAIIIDSFIRLLIKKATPWIGKE